MRKLIVIMSVVCGLFVLVAQAKVVTPTIKANFELAESVPLGTIFGQPGVRRTQQVWLDMINSAKHSIDLGAFYFQEKHFDGPMAKVINALKNAAKRGVKIRIIIGQLMAKESLQALGDLPNNPNVRVRVIPFGKIAGGVMHAKYMVVDHIDSFVGSANFDWRALTQVHEIGARVRNRKLAATILHVFNLDWQLCQTKGINQHQALLFKSYGFLPVSSQRPIIVKDAQGHTLLIHVAFSPKSLVPMGLDWEQQQFIKLLDNAHFSVEMQVLTFSPDAGFNRKGYWAALDSAIRRAAGRGVKVKLIVSNWSQKYPMINYLKSLSLVPNVQVKISTLPPYQGKFIPFSRVEHCKYFIVDHDLAWVGTGNWQWGYFFNTRDIALIIKGYAANKLLSSIFYRDWNGPYTKYIDVNKRYHAPKTH